MKTITVDLKTKTVFDDCKVFGKDVDLGFTLFLVRGISPTHYWNRFESKELIDMQKSMCFFKALGKFKNHQL